MPLSSLPALASRLSNVLWEWSAGAWPRLSAQLGLELVEDVGERKTYSFVEGEQLDVYFWGSEIDSIEINVDVFLDPDELSEVEYEDKVDEYYAKWEEACRLVEGVLGKPQFADGAAARGFPEDRDAVWVGSWALPNARLMVEQRHEDRELPFRICLAVASPKEHAAPTGQPS